MFIIDYWLYTMILKQDDMSMKVHERTTSLEKGDKSQWMNYGFKLSFIQVKSKIGWFPSFFFQIRYAENLYILLQNIDFLGENYIRI